MLKSFTEKIYQGLTGKKNLPVISLEHQREKLAASKVVRSRDFVLQFDVINGKARTADFATLANWNFILTTAAVYFEQTKNKDLPRVSIKFQNLAPSTPFNTLTDELGFVPADVVFGREGSGRFEEYKNLYYSLDRRFVVHVDVRSNPGYTGRGYVLLSGVEVSDEVLDG